MDLDNGEVDRYAPVKTMAKEKSKLLEKRRITVDFENMTPAQLRRLNFKNQCTRELGPTIVDALKK